MIAGGFPDICVYACSMFYDSCYQAAESAVGKNSPDLFHNPYKHPFKKIQNNPGPADTAQIFLRENVLMTDAPPRAEE
jgi:hypothetical protein